MEKAELVLKWRVMVVYSDAGWARVGRVRARVRARVRRRNRMVVVWVCRSWWCGEWEWVEMREEC